MRVLRQVSSAAFDIPTETFAIELVPGAEAAPVLAAIEELGYVPEVLERPPTSTKPMERLDHPTSPALSLTFPRATSRLFQNWLRRSISRGGAAMLVA